MARNRHLHLSGTGKVDSSTRYACDYRGDRSPPGVFVQAEGSPFISRKPICASNRITSNLFWK